jgi:hypothetical protein
MKICHKGRCHFCQVPLDPYVAIFSVFEYMQVLAWSAYTDVDVSANDSWYKILNFKKTVKLCRDCFYATKPSFREILKRETTGLRLESPKRKSWNDMEIWKWYNGITTCPVSFYDMFDHEYPYAGFAIEIKFQ